jgi:hypothetical protein
MIEGVLGELEGRVMGKGGIEVSPMLSTDGETDRNNYLDLDLRDY